MPRSRVTSKGQVVIPAEIRKRLGIRKGTIVLVEQRGEEVVMRPLTKAYLEKFLGIFKGEDSLCDELLAERARDKEREDKLCQ